MLDLKDSSMSDLRPFNEILDEAKLNAKLNQEVREAQEVNNQMLKVICQDLGIDHIN